MSVNMFVLTLWVCVFFLFYHLVLRKRDKRENVSALLYVCLCVCVCVSALHDAFVDVFIHIQIR